MKSNRIVPSARASAKSASVVGLLLAALALVVAGCAASTRLVTHAAGHVVTADIEGAPSTEIVATEGVIASSHGRVTIEKARARIEGNDWVRIPEDVPVAVRMSRHKITLAAGHVTITRNLR